MGYSRVILIGQAVRKPEVRRVNDMLTGAEFPLRVERTYRTASGEARLVKAEIPIVAFGGLAEYVAGLDGSGTVDVLVEGRIREERGDVGPDGKRGPSRYSVVADRCEFDGAAAARAHADRQLVAAGA